MDSDLPGLTRAETQTENGKLNTENELVAAYIRSSPKHKDETEESVAQQKAAIENAGYTRAHYYIDVDKKGDSADRPELLKLFKDAEKWHYKKLVCYHPDRLARGWLGLKWLHESIIPLGMQPVFITGCPNVTNADGELDPTSYLFYSLITAMSYFDLMNIRRNTARGRAKAHAEHRYGKGITPEQRDTAAALILLHASEQDVSEACRKLDIERTTLERWARDLRQRHKETV